MSSQAKKPILEKLAKAKQIEAGGDRKSEDYQKSVCVNSHKAKTIKIKVYQK